METKFAEVVNRYWYVHDVWHQMSHVEIRVFAPSTLRFQISMFTARDN